MVAVVEGLCVGLREAPELALAPDMQLGPLAVPAMATIREALTMLHIVDAIQIPLPGVTVLVAAVLVDGCEALSVITRNDVGCTPGKTH